jgi:predicted DNA binding CopG/RHH family protein
MKKLKRIPKFENEKEERKFWQKADSTEYVDYSKTERWVFPNLKLSSVPITIRMPESLLDRVKIRDEKCGQETYVYNWTRYISNWLKKGLSI